MSTGKVTAGNYSVIENFRFFELRMRVGKKVKPLIEAGKYKSVDPEIFLARLSETHYRPFTTIDVFLIEICRNAGTNEVFSSMEKYGFRPVGLREVLSFGIYYPTEQSKYPIVGLDSIAGTGKDTSKVPVLEFGVDRELCLEPFDREWGRNYHFLAVQMPRNRY